MSSALRFLRVNGIGEKEISISKKAREALIEIARENELNAERVKTLYGIDISNLEEEEE